ncbi:MAG: MOSC domain-containing protein YiiM [Marinobacter maritimus]|jgi:MOSC domain-containing protein YiiM|tara:strand:- start:11 stop:295 length:285 start_codon:yes stop_codon:yes gene_type:complete
MATGIVIRQLRIGNLTKLGGTDTLTGIHKREIDSAYLGVNGLNDDQQGDKRHHGGPEKALHHFTSDHYARLRCELQEGRRFGPGLLKQDDANAP